ncbi:MAG: hypothetical protein Q9160_000501 [Pyrenula sp. 1 TL-2023]
MNRGFNFVDQSSINYPYSDPPLPQLNNDAQEEFGPAHTAHYEALPTTTQSYQTPPYFDNTSIGHGFGGGDFAPNAPMLETSDADAFFEEEPDGYRGPGSDHPYDTSYMEASGDEFSSNQNQTMPTSVYSSDNEKQDLYRAKQQSPRELSQSSTSDATIQAGLSLAAQAPSPLSSQHSPGRASVNVQKVTKAQKKRPRTKDKGKGLSPRAERAFLKSFSTECNECPSHVSPSSMPSVDDFFRQPTEVEQKHLEGLRGVPMAVLSKWFETLHATGIASHSSQEGSEFGSNPDSVFRVDHAACLKNGMPASEPQNGRRKWACTCCKMSYPSKWNWRRHEESNLFDWPCPQEGCSAVYPRQDKLPNHLRNIHGITAKVDPQPRPLHQSFRRHCGLCDDDFEDPSAFLDHVALHWDGKKPGYIPGLCTMEQWRWDKPDVEMSNVDGGDDDNDGDDGNDGDNDDGNDGDSDRNGSNNDFSQDFDGGNNTGDNGGGGSGNDSSKIIQEPYFFIESNNYQNSGLSSSIQGSGDHSGPGQAQLLFRAQGLRAITWTVTASQPSILSESFSLGLPHAYTFGPSTKFETLLVGGVSHSEKDYRETMGDHCESILHTSSGTSLFPRRRTKLPFSGLTNVTENPRPQPSSQKALKQPSLHENQQSAQAAGPTNNCPTIRHLPSFYAQDRAGFTERQASNRSPSPKIHTIANDQRGWLEYLAEVLTLDPDSPKVDQRMLQLHAQIMNYMASAARSTLGTQNDNQWSTKSLVAKEEDGARVSLSTGGQASAINQLLMSMNVKPTKKMKRVLEKSLSDVLEGTTPQCEFVLNLSLPRLRSQVVVKGLVNGVTGQVNLAMQLSTGASVLSRFITSSIDRFGLGRKLMDLARNQNLNIAWTGNQQGSFRPGRLASNSKAIGRRRDEIEEMNRHVEDGGTVIIHDKAVARPLHLLTEMCSFHLQHALPICSNVEPVSPSSIAESVDSSSSKANLRQDLTRKIRNFSLQKKVQKPRANSKIRRSGSPSFRKNFRRFLPKVLGRKEGDSIEDKLSKSHGHDSTT